MRVDQLEQVFRALNQAGVRYIVVGGLAVIAHGYMRYTKDVDLVMAFEPQNLRKGIGALLEIGFRPKIPVDAMEFADEQTRERWAREKGMIVFQLISLSDDALPIDVFVRPRFNFEEEYERAFIDESAPETFVRFVHVERLLAMKKEAGRPADLADIEMLERLRRM